MVRNFQTCQKLNLKLTLSELELEGGNLMATPPQSSEMDWINFPPAPIIVLWILDGIIKSTDTTLAISAWIEVSFS